MVGIVASRRQRAHGCGSAQNSGWIFRSIIGRKMVGGVLTGALSVLLLVTGATVTLAQSASHSKGAAKTGGVPLPPLPPVPGPHDASVTIPLPLLDLQLLERQSEPDCEIPASDRLLGPIPETTRLIYERQCYKNAETLVRGKLQLLQDAVAGTLKAANNAAASRTLQPAAGGEPGAPALVKDVATAPKADAAAKGSKAPGDADDQREEKSDASGDQMVEPPDQHRKPAATARLDLSSREDPKSSLSEQEHREKTHGAQTNPSAQSKPAMASAKVACQADKPAAAHGPWSWRLIDGRKCWYEGAVGMDRTLLHWSPLDGVTRPLVTRALVPQAPKSMD